MSAALQLTDAEWSALVGAVAYQEVTLEDRSGTRRELAALDRAFTKIRTAAGR